MYKVEDKKSGDVFAVKKTKEYGDGVSITTVREVSVLRDCVGSKNIVHLHEVCMAPHLDTVFMVLEFVPFDMGCVLQSIRGRPLPVASIKQLFLQLLNGVCELHERGYMHRDIKMTNLLLSHSGILKIADLGLARTIRSSDRWKQPLEASMNTTTLKTHRQAEAEQREKLLPGELLKELIPRYTSTVVTLWYRAPEVLLGAGRYDEKLDIWSCGCILAELLMVKPLLPGKTDPDQLERTLRLLGMPNDHVWSNFEKMAQKNLLAAIPPGIPPATSPPSTEVWRSSFSQFDDITQDFITKLLAYDPAKRPTAREAMSHPFFTQIPLPADPQTVADQISVVYKPRKYDK